MATINNLSQAADDALKAAENDGSLTDSGQAGVQQFTVGQTTVFTSDSDIKLEGADHAILKGTTDAAVTGNANDNLVVGNDGSNNIDAGAGNDQVSTGAGDDQISLGEGDDVVEINGAGTKVIDGGAGNDTFVIKGTATGSETTFTGLNSGDKLRVSADANHDGKIDLNDVDSGKTGLDANGNTKITLTDGTSFTLEGVHGGPFDGTLKYEIGTDEDGNLIVDITDGTV